MEPFNKFPRILIEQDAEPMLLNFKRKRFELPVDEQILTTNSRHTHYSWNKKRILIKKIPCTDNAITTLLILAIYSCYSYFRFN